jgi:hypothetical protein
MLHNKNTKFISELQSYFTSNEKTVSALFQIIRSLHFLTNSFTFSTNAIHNILLNRYL